MRSRSGGLQPLLSTETQRKTQRADVMVDLYGGRMTLGILRILECATPPYAGRVRVMFGAVQRATLG